MEVQIQGSRRVRAELEPVSSLLKDNAAPSENTVPVLLLLIDSHDGCQACQRENEALPPTGQPGDSVLLICLPQAMGGCDTRLQVRVLTFI